MAISNIPVLIDNMKNDCSEYFNVFPMGMMLISPTGELLEYQVKTNKAEQKLDKIESYFRSLDAASKNVKESAADLFL